MIDTLIKSDNRAYQSTAHGLGGGRARHHGSHSESSLQEATEKPARFARQRLPRRGSSPSKNGRARDKYTWPPRVPAVIAGNARAHGDRPVPWRPAGALPAPVGAARTAQATSGGRPDPGRLAGAQRRPAGVRRRRAASACSARAHGDRPVPWRPSGARRRLAAASSHRKVRYGLPRPRVAKRHAWGAAES